MRIIKYMIAHFKQQECYAEDGTNTPNGLCSARVPHKYITRLYPLHKNPSRR